MNKSSTSSLAAQHERFPARYKIAFVTHLLLKLHCITQPPSPLTCGCDAARNEPWDEGIPPEAFLAVPVSQWGHLILSKF